MPMIDDLAPASSASDSDEFIVSQAGIVRKITRAQVLNGVQSQLAVPSGSLLGNSGSGFGTPEVITVGRNLNFNGSTLSAAAAPFIINNLPTGTVPSSGDLISMSQAGTAVAVTYGQLLNGIAGIPNINLTHALVTPAGATTVQTLGQLTAAMLPLTGGTLTGGLSLSGTPISSTQAASKGYVDQQLAAALPLVGGSLSGMLTLCGTPQYPLQAATKAYADSIGASALSSTGGSLSGTLLLNADPATPLQAATKQYVDGQLMARLTCSGGTLTGPLTLVGVPTTPLQAAIKSYVDANPSSEGVINVKLPPYNAKIDGVTDDTAAFRSAYQNATAGATIYVPSRTTVLQQPGTWGIALTKRVRWIVAGTVLPDGTPLAAAIPTGGGPSTLTLPGFVIGNTLSGLTTSQGSSQSTDFAVNQSSYIVNHSGGTNGTVLSNARVDTIIYSSPSDHVWGGLDRLIWAGTQTPSPATPAQHVGRYIQTVRQATTIGSNGSYLPQPQLWGACIEYRDATGQPSSATNASLTIEMDWFGNGLDDADSRTIQSLVIGQTNTAGPAVEVGTIVGVYLSEGSSGSAKTVFAIDVPFSSAILDASDAHALNNAPVIKMSADLFMQWVPCC